MVPLVAFFPFVIPLSDDNENFQAQMFFSRLIYSQSFFFSFLFVFRKSFFITRMLCSGKSFGLQMYPFLVCPFQSWTLGHIVFTRLELVKKSNKEKMGRSTVHWTFPISVNSSIVRVLPSLFRIFNQSYTLTAEFVWKIRETIFFHTNFRKNYYISVSKYKNSPTLWIIFFLNQYLFSNSMCCTRKSKKDK